MIKRLSTLLLLASESELEVIEVACPRYAALRNAISAFVQSLSDDADDVRRNIWWKFRRGVFSPEAWDQEWLTDYRGMADSLTRLGNVEWCCAFDRVMRTAETLVDTQNPLREQFISALGRAGAQSVRVACGSWERPSFIEAACGVLPLTAEHFLTVKRYNDSDPFDMLITVGPFRSRRARHVFDSLLVAPRHRRHLNIRWAGDRDSEDFPLVPRRRGESASVPLKRTRRPAGGGAGDLPENDIPDVPEDDITSEIETVVLGAHNRLGPNAGYQPDRAVCVSTDDGRFTLVPIGKHGAWTVLSFDPDAVDEEAVRRRRVPLSSAPSSDDSLEIGMFLILEEGTATGTDEHDGDYGKAARRQRWKHELQQKIDTLGVGEVSARLVTVGVRTAAGNHNVRRWADARPTQLNSPKSKDEFRLLIQWLGIVQDSPELERVRPWWVEAWRELSYLKGQAISRGLIAGQEMDSVILAALRQHLALIRTHSEKAGSFRLEIECEESQIAVLFARVADISEDFDGVEFQNPPYSTPRLFPRQELDRWLA